MSGRLFAVRPEVQARLAVAVPLVALLLSVFVVYPAWGNYQITTQQIQQKRKELAELKATALPEPEKTVSAVRDVPSEPPEFLGQVRALAAQSNLELGPFQVSAGERGGDGPVRAVRARVELIGTYAQIRDFLYRLEHAGRLYVVTSLDVIQDTARPNPFAAPAAAGTLHATVEIERYVAPPAAAPATTS